jgi:hypothetical protein
MEGFFVIDQNRSSANWPLAKILQRHGDAETGFKDFSDRAVARTPTGPIRIDSGACKEELLAKGISFLDFSATF